MSNDSILWSLYPPDGRPSWLFGTMHIRDDRVYQLCHAVYPLIRQADVYVGEMDLSPIQQDPGGPQYDMREHFTLKSYFKLRKQLLKSFHLDVDKYIHLHPLIILGALSQSILESDHSASLDEHLWDFAKENNRQLQGLESMQRQVDILHSIDPVPLYAQIRDIASRPGIIRQHSAKALDYYLEGSIHALYQLTKSSMHRLRKKIIFERNAWMVDQISSFDPTLSYFIAVGAGHFSGRYGIITLLRKKGWVVKPLYLNKKKISR